MTRSYNQSRTGLVIFLFALASIILMILPESGRVARVLTPQGKGGEVIAKPTPTPKKSTPPKRSVAPARTTRKSTPPTNRETDNARAGEIAFWNSIKDSTNPDDYRAYLKKYPDGQFAEIAQNKIKGLEAAAERSFWENIKNTANPEDLRAYLTKYPNGMYADAARNRLDALETAAKETATKEEAARKEEARRKEEEAAKKRPGAVVKNSSGMELVYVPAGSFMMGSTNGSNDEKPAHQVTINYSFYMGKYEVTQAQWQSVMGNNPSYFKDCGGNCPVEQVSWDDAQEFIYKLNRLDVGYRYRLPTEAEWEYTCRAGTTGDYAGPINVLGWYDGNSGDRTHPSGQKEANAFGLYDMHGNVGEWCDDWFHYGYDGAPTDGSAWLSGVEQKYRALRGGSWNGNAFSLRSANRNAFTPGLRWNYFGFRVVAVARTQ